MKLFPENARPSEARLWWGWRIVLAGAALALLLSGPLLLLASVDLLATMVAGVLILFAGCCVMTVRITCRACGFRHYLCGRPTRLHCPRWVTPLFEDDTSPPSPSQDRRVVLRRQDLGRPGGGGRCGLLPTGHAQSASR